MVQRTRDGRTGQVLSGRMIGRSGDAVCGLPVHVEKRNAGFLVEPQNQGRRFISDWASKPLERFSLVWPPNRWQWFSSLASKPMVTVYSGLASKLVVMVSLSLASKPVVGFLVEPQNQGGGGFLSLRLKIGSYGLMI
jgi:hypothetical protein